MNYGLLKYTHARIILGLALITAFIFGPGWALLVVAIIGSLLFPFYIEGLLFVFWYELMSGVADGSYWPLYFWATIFVLLAIGLGQVLRSRLMV